MRLLCSAVIVMLVYMAGITAVSAYALDNNIYLADAHPHYRHPVTGVIEDSGGDGSEVLGQSMTEGALRTEALIEVDTDGKMYATIRLGLMDNIEDPQFMVQKDGHSSFYDVSADLMKENYDDNESDFRFEIPSEKSIVRCTFYVVAMGRDVVFYIDFDNIRVGSGDFVTSIQVKKHTTKTDSSNNNTQPTQTTTARPAQNTTAPTTTTSTTTAIRPTQTTTAQTTVKTSQTTEKPKTTTTTKKTSASTSRTESSSLAESSSQDETTSVTTTVSLPETSAESRDTSDVKGLELFDENGSKISNDSSSQSEKTGNDSEKSGNALVPVAIAGAAVVIVGGAGLIVWKKRRL